MTPAERRSLTATITESMRHVNDWQTEALYEAIIKADELGIDVQDALRRLAAAGEKFDMPSVLEALRPSTAGIEVPYHLPSCDCGGTGWVDFQADGTLLPSDEHPGLGGYVDRCSGDPITPGQFAAWQRSHAETPVRQLSP